MQAAQGLADDIDGQVEIVMSLMEVSAEEARGAVLRMAQRKETNSFTVASRTGAPRTVVVERRIDPAPDGTAGYSQRRFPGSEITRFDTSRCQMKRTISAPTVAPIRPAPSSG